MRFNKIVGVVRFHSRQYKPICDIRSQNRKNVAQLTFSRPTRAYITK
jgi:hypothetical protein